jgi:flagellar motor switch protein FliN/FliY
VTEAIEYEQFDQTAHAGERAGSEVDLSRLSEIPMELSVEIGRTHMTVGETLDLRVGSVVTLERLAGEPADLLVNGSTIARGEVVVIDEQFGLRVTEILDSQQDASLLAQAPGAANADAPADDEAAGQEAAGQEAAGQDTGQEAATAASPVAEG